MDISPRLIGGASALYEAVTYPDSARVAWIQGTVRVQFMVEVDGEATEIKIVESVHELLDAEVRRTIGEMTFAPGLVDGEPVRAQMTLPIRFELQKERTMADHAIADTATADTATADTATADTATADTATADTATADAATTDNAGHAADAAESKVEEDLPEQPPELIGGLASLQREIQYPQKAKRMGVQGRVMVGFVVQEDGTPTDVRVTRSVHRLLDAEAVRVVRTLRFVPAKKGEEPVPVDMTMPVTFRTR